MILISIIDITDINDSYIFQNTSLFKLQTNWTPPQPTNLHPANLGTIHTGISQHELVLQAWEDGIIRWRVTRSTVYGYVVKITMGWLHDFMSPIPGSTLDIGYIPISGYNNHDIPWKYHWIGSTPTVGSDRLQDAIDRHEGENQSQTIYPTDRAPLVYFVFNQYDLIPGFPFCLKKWNQLTNLHATPGWTCLPQIGSTHSAQHLSPIRSLKISVFSNKRCWCAGTPVWAASFAFNLLTVSKGNAENSKTSPFTILSATGSLHISNAERCWGD